ncbi:hypothetical protein BJX70DRAFT_396127 [Aspergillus crustosus]
MPSSTPSSAREHAPTPVPVVAKHRKFFAGEIVSVASNTYYHTELIAKDTVHDALRIGFTFPKEDSDYTIPPDLLTPGVTVLILGPTKSRMGGGGDGIEVDNVRHVKV